jgi:Flp pilus assembly protein TadG
MRTAGSREERSARGQSLIEFALALPAFLILFLGLIEVALILRSQLVLTNANREAARYASRGLYTDEEIAAKAVDAFAGQLPNYKDNTSITITRYRIPAVPTSEDQPRRFPVYVTGTFVTTDDLGSVISITPQSRLSVTVSSLAADNAGFFTDHDLVYVETFYRHHLLLNAPLVDFFVRDPITLYVQTVMRMSRAQVLE